MCTMPLLAKHVLGVIATRPEKEMVRAHTRWIVTTVQTEQAREDHPVGKFECHAMGRELYPVYLESPIPVSRTWTLPEPASVSLKYMGPEAFIEWNEGIAEGPTLFEQYFPLPERIIDGRTANGAAHTRQKRSTGIPISLQIGVREHWRKDQYGALARRAALSPVKCSR